MGSAARSALVVTGGEELISTYAWNTKEAQHYFCKVCGIYTHHAMRGETESVGVNMACIEGFDVLALDNVDVENGKEWSVVQNDSAV